MQLAEFLRQRLDEDEAAALAAAEVPDGDFVMAALPLPLFEGLKPGFPKRVLAEVAAKRAIIEEATEADAIERTAADNAGWDGDKYDTAGSAILRHLAAVYSAHPDYDERWRP